MDAPTLIRSEPISPEDIKAACETPLAYIAILHRYLDGGLSALSAPAQLVFLHLVRETLARGRRTVRIAIRTLVERTGLAKDTVSAAVRALASPEIDLLTIVSRGGPHAPACYEVRWYTCRKLDPDSPPARTRLRLGQRAGSIEHRLQELTDEDRTKLEQCYRSLPPNERRDLEERVMGRLQDLGITVDKRLFQQLVLFETLRTCMYHHARTHYPHAFSYHPVA